MTTHSIPSRAFATLAGCIFLTGTLGVLFEDVILHGAAFSLKHYLALVIVGGTLAAGILSDIARRQGNWWPIITFTVLFLAGTSLVIYSSAGRQAEKTLISGAEHDKAARERVQIEADLADDRATLKRKKAEADAECASGEGKRCRSARASVDFYDKSVKGLEARLKALDPERPVSAEAEQFASTVAVIFGWDKDRVRALAILLEPFAKTLFYEFGTIWCFGFAFSPARHRRSVASEAAPTDSKPSRSDREQTSFPTIEPEEEAEAIEVLKPALPKRPPNGGVRTPNGAKPSNLGPSGGSGRSMTRDEVLTDLMLRSATGRTFRSQREAAEHYGVSASRFSEWLKAWEADGSIPQRRMIGHRKVLIAE